VAEGRKARLIGGVDYGLLAEIIREELTSGDPVARRVLAELLLSATLRDSAGGELSGHIRNLDVALTTLSRLVRWGRDVSPVWVHGGEVTAPPAGTALASKTVSAGKTGYIYGFYISAGEPNEFRINWVSSGTPRSLRIVFPGRGSLMYTDVIPLNEGLPANPGTDITITNVNPGSAGVTYQAALLVAEV